MKNIYPKKWCTTYPIEVVKLYLKNIYPPKKWYFLYSKKHIRKVVKLYLKTYGDPAVTCYGSSTQQRISTHYCTEVNKHDRYIQ